jgi:large conductance mechanosensitive channel
MQFIRSYAIIGVAIGIVIGQAAAKVITTIVEGLVMPVIGVILPGEKWQDAVFYFGRAHIKIGLIIAALLDFFTVALVVFLLVRYILKVETPKE